MNKKEINQRLEKFKFGHPTNRYERGWNDGLEAFKLHSKISTKKQDQWLHNLIIMCSFYKGLYSSITKLIA